MQGEPRDAPPGGQGSAPDDGTLAGRTRPKAWLWLALAAALGFEAGCAPSAPPDPKVVVIPVEGMVCDACAKSIDSEVEKVDGVEACEITFAAGEATVRFDANRTDPAAISAAIDKLGYHAGEPRPAS